MRFKKLLQKIAAKIKDKNGELLYFEPVWKVFVAVIIGSLLFCGCYFLFTRVLFPGAKNSVDGFLEDYDNNAIVEQYEDEFPYFGQEAN